MKQSQPKQRSKRPRPSYEEGELRDKSIEKLMDPDYRKGDLKKLLARAAKSRRQGSR
jgi:hypothetical protein